MNNNRHLNLLSSNHPGQGNSRILSTVAAKASRLGFRALLLLFVIASLQTLFVTDARADLTVRAVENADGSATFSLRGTSSVGDFGTFPTTTNFSPWPSLPPLTSPGFFFPLPSGLTLSSGTDEVQPIEAFASVGPAWVLTGNSGFASSGKTISGSGSVRVENFPFFFLTPGTFRVEALPLPAEDDNPEESALSGVGVYPFNTVYEVIPFDRSPSLTARAPGTLTSMSGVAASGTIKITNNGNTPIENLVVSEKSRDFKLGKPLRTSLAPGDSTTCRVTFSSRRSSAITKVLITAATPARVFEAPEFVTSEQVTDVAEARPLPVTTTIPGEPVSSSVTVKGVNKAAVRAPRNPVRFLQSRSRR